VPGAVALGAAGSPGSPWRAARSVAPCGPWPSCADVMGGGVAGALRGPLAGAGGRGSPVPLRPWRGSWRLWGRRRGAAGGVRSRGRAARGLDTSPSSCIGVCRGAIGGGELHAMSHLGGAAAACVSAGGWGGSRSPMASACAARRWHWGHLMPGHLA